ncbi:hypothetical protein BH11PSE4_BH11PSE4_06610 [soil metagenome]
MARFLGELLFAMLRAIIFDWLYELMLKAAAWLDAELPGRRTKLVIGMLLGVAAFFIIPVVTALVTGLLSF